MAGLRHILHLVVLDIYLELPNLYRNWLVPMWCLPTSIWLVVPSHCWPICGLISHLWTIPVCHYYWNHNKCLLPASGRGCHCFQHGRDGASKISGTILRSLQERPVWQTPRIMGMGLYHQTKARCWNICKQDLPLNLDEFLEENLKLWKIRPSKSLIESPFFFIKKEDGSLRAVQDYWKLNAMTVKIAIHSS